MEWVIDCLRENGGKGWPREVSKWVWDKHRKELEGSELMYTWQYDIRWAAQKLRHEGKLKPVHGRRDLPWELASKATGA